MSAADPLVHNPPVYFRRRHIQSCWMSADRVYRKSSFLTIGKSSLTVQFVDGHFVDSYYPTIENTFSKVIRYKNQDFAVEMIDTAGQVRV